MEPLLLFCKTYSNDLRRAQRLVRSIERYNADSLPLWLSVPASELDLFRGEFKGHCCTLVADEAVLRASASVYGEMPADFPQHLYQQLVKLEFWRLGLCRNYLWLDADSYFIRPFFRGDFLHPDGMPFTVRHQCEDLLDFAERTGRHKIVRDYHATRKHLRTLFERKGPEYDFGPSPVVWSVLVLEDMYRGYLQPRKETVYSLLRAYPCELLLYGEFVLARKAIALYPVPPLFKVYHYLEQFLEDEQHGVDREELRQQYLGVVMQSNWARLPQPRRSLLSRIPRAMHRFRGR